MTTDTCDLLSLIPAEVPEVNRVPHLRAKMMEVMDNATGEVWMSLDEVTPAQAKALEIGPRMVKYGPAVSSMDLAWFDRSPGASTDGPLAEREIGGLRFRLVAKPGKFTPLPGGSGVEAMVDKHHCVVFAAGRDLEFLINPQGFAFVEQVDALADSKPIELPPGFSLRRLTLSKPWVLRAPRPAKAYFFFPSFRSFQGPIIDMPG
jgi:hypothetical protein